MMVAEEKFEFLKSHKTKWRKTEKL
jgi:hypothetical protein